MVPLFPIPFLPRSPRRIGPLACSYPCRLRPGHIQSGGYSVFKVHCARIVRPALQKQQAKKWPLPKSKSEVSCGFAESQVFRFPSHKRRKALKTLDFPRRSKNDLFFQKLFRVFLFSPLGSALYRRLRGNTMPPCGTSQNREARIHAGLQVSPPLSFAVEIGANR